MRFAATNEHTMHGRRLVVILAVLCTVTLVAQAPATSGRWSEARAAQWYAAQPWLVGSNYIPATAINELEMWQAETFDPATIDKELGWAEDLGMTTMRVFLHDLPWQQDAAGYRARIDRFLVIAAKHHIKPLFVLFDSCWDPNPRLGPQHAPTPGVHNSGWVQSPGAPALKDPAQYPRLRQYVVGVIGAFGKDARVLGWDVWNEPDNTNGSSYGTQEPSNKVELVLALLPQVFAWAREAGIEQPLTSGVWKGDWSADEKLSAMERIQLEQSDVISFHNYDNGPEFEKRITWLQRYQPPDPLHRVHGTRQRQHVPGLAAAGEAVPRRGHQLGLRRGQDADVSPLGLVAETLCRPRAVNLVSRDSSSRMARRTGRTRSS